MIDTGANDGQPQCDVDGVVKSQRLQRDQALIVIHADVDVGQLSHSRRERGVGRGRADCRDPQSPGGVDGRLDDRLLFAMAEQAVLAGVGIEAANGDSGGSMMTP